MEKCRGGPVLGTDQVIYCSTCDLLKQFCKTKKKVVFVAHVPNSKSCFKFPAKTKVTSTTTTTSTTTIRATTTAPPSTTKYTTIAATQTTTNTSNTATTPTSTTTPTAIRRENWEVMG